MGAWEVKYIGLAETRSPGFVLMILDERRKMPSGRLAHKSVWFAMCDAVTHMFFLVAPCREGT